MYNILLVSHCDFPDNSAVHVHHFANELIKLGVDCVVAVPNDKTTVATMPHSLYKVTQFNEIATLTECFADRRPPDLVHAWTPREHVKAYCYSLAMVYHFKQVIHLEDNEECITERLLQQSLQEIDDLDPDAFPPNLSHPRHYRTFLNTADGVTAIVDRLQEFVPAWVPSIVLWPGVDTSQFFPRSPDSELAARFTVPLDATVICYTGNVHAANQKEVESLYRAVIQRHHSGQPTILMRTGLDWCSPTDGWIGEADQACIRSLGYVDRALIPDILALADILVQPGQADAFNEYRFPSKIPEFLAMGKPVILPATNIGRYLKSMQEAIVLPVVDESHLLEAITAIAEHPETAQTLAEGAVQFAKTRLNWADRGHQLLAFYQRLLSEAALENAAIPQNTLKRVRSHAQELQSQLDRMLGAQKTLQSRVQALTDAHTHTQAQLQQTQRELAQTHAQLAQTETERTQWQTQCQDVQQAWQQNQVALQLTQAQLAQAQARQAAMESSKFWKLRTLWIRLKTRMGLEEAPSSKE